MGLKALWDWFIKMEVLTMAINEDYNDEDRSLDYDPDDYEDIRD